MLSITQDVSDFLALEAQHTLVIFLQIDNQQNHWNTIANLADRMAGRANAAVDVPLHGPIMSITSTLSSSVAYFFATMPKINMKSYILLI